MGGLCVCKYVCGMEYGNRFVDLIKLLNWLID